MVSKFSLLLIIFCCYIILYISLNIIITYFNPSGLIYLNIYSIYNILFIITLIFAISSNYYIYNDTNLNKLGLTPPSETTTETR
jgi:ABC-type glycerol-3-phosphate transport system substrate-binding protein